MAVSFNIRSSKKVCTKVIILRYMSSDTTTDRGKQVLDKVLLRHIGDIVQPMYVKKDRQNTWGRMDEGYENPSTF